MPATLAKVSGDIQVVQAFPLTTASKCNITSASGEITDVNIIRCIGDGDVAVVFADSTTVTISMVAGDDYTFPYKADITAVSGTYMVA